jgi:excisionase family DNA binding protein
MSQRSGHLDSPIGRVYTTKEVAHILRTSQRMVQWLIQHQRLKATRIGQSYRVLETDLQAFCTYEPLTSPTPLI